MGPIAGLKARLDLAKPTHRAAGAPIPTEDGIDTAVARCRAVSLAPRRVTASAKSVGVQLCKLGVKMPADVECGGQAASEVLGHDNAGWLHALGGAAEACRSCPAGGVRASLDEWG